MVDLFRVLNLSRGRESVGLPGGSVVNSPASAGDTDWLDP